MNNLAALSASRLFVAAGTVSVAAAGQGKGEAAWPRRSTCRSASSRSARPPVRKR